MSTIQQKLEVVFSIFGVINEFLILEFLFFYSLHFYAGNGLGVASSLNHRSSKI